MNAILCQNPRHDAGYARDFEAVEQGGPAAYDGPPIIAASAPIR